MTNAAGMLRLSLQGERPKRALARLARKSPLLAKVAMRELPRVLRKHVVVGAEAPRALLWDDVVDDSTHVVPFRAGAAGGAMLLDRAAGVTLVRGTFGGADGAPELGDEASPAERAIVKRFAASLWRGFAMAMQSTDWDALGEIDAAAVASHPLACVELVLTRAEEIVGKISLLLPLAALDDAAAAPSAEPADPRVADALQDVEVEAIAELGRVRMPFSTLSELRVGDVVRLPVAESALVSVRVGDKPLLRGRPTTAGGRIAIEIDGHET